MDTKRTPQAWTVWGVQEIGNQVLLVSDDGRSRFVPADVAAAAPDLLEALQDALRSVAADVEHYEDQVHHGTYAEAQDDLDEAQELYAKMRAAIAKAEGK